MTAASQCIGWFWTVSSSSLSSAVSFCNVCIGCKVEVSELSSSLLNSDEGWDTNKTKTANETNDTKVYSFKEGSYWRNKISKRNSQLRNHFEHYIKNYVRSRCSRILFRSNKKSVSPGAAKPGIFFWTYFQISSLVPILSFWFHISNLNYFYGVWLWLFAPVDLKHTTLT